MKNEKRKKGEFIHLKQVAGARAVLISRRRCILILSSESNG